MGRHVDDARSNYVVTDYHTELVQMIIALERTILNISKYSLTCDDLLKSDVTDQFTDYLFNLGSLQRAFTH